MVPDLRVSESRVSLIIACLFLKFPGPRFQYLDRIQMSCVAANFFGFVSYLPISSMMAMTV